MGQHTAVDANYQGEARERRRKWLQSVEAEVNFMLTPMRSTLDPKADWSLPKAKKVEGVGFETVS